MGVRTEKLCTFRADDPIAKSRTFCGASYDADVEGRDVNIFGHGFSANAHMSLSFSTTCAWVNLAAIIFSVKPSLGCPE